MVIRNCVISELSSHRSITLLYTLHRRIPIILPIKRNNILQVLCICFRHTRYGDVIWTTVNDAADGPFLFKLKWLIRASEPEPPSGDGQYLVYMAIQSGHKLFTTFQTYINHKVLELSGNGLHCLKEPLTFFRVN
jgi:hypothetical protein